MPTNIDPRPTSRQPACRCAGKYSPPTCAVSGVAEVTIVAMLFVLVTIARFG
jgi:hypothetical protein